jgi:hypothetical protein
MMGGLWDLIGGRVRSRIRSNGFGMRQLTARISQSKRADIKSGNLLGYIYTRISPLLNSTQVAWSAYMLIIDNYQQALHFMLPDAKLNSILRAPWPHLAQALDS